tara:strand:- start:9560 stop:11461 length:1902 start_codon:yes stop_codon:yes gene_type:complete
MATVKEINIVVNTDQAEKPTEDLKKSFDGLNDTIKDSGKVSKKTVEDTGKASKKSSKSVGLLSKGFKGIGTAIKAAGIGLVIGLIASLTAALAGNQKIMDAVNTVFETVSIIMAQVSNAIVTVYESVAKSSENFNGLSAVMKGLLTIAITPLKLAFFAIKLAIQEGQLAWEKSFFGGNDKDKIKELTLGVLETKKSIIETGKDAIKAGVNVVTNFGDMVGEISTIATNVGDEIGKISVKSAAEQAKINIQLKNSALLAVAQQQLLVEKYDILAEKQRQIRDEERNTIDERIAANNELGKVLEMQEKSMIATANAQLAAAQADVNKNNTIEAQVALVEALANKEGVLAQVEGFRSEQLINDLGLKREQIELDNTISDREKERQLAKLDFEAELAETEAGKNEKLQERLDLENEIIVEDLERKRELFKEGTLARVEAEQEFLDAEQVLKQKQQTLDNKILKESVEAKKKSDDDKIDLENKVGQAKESIANRTASLLIQLGGKAAKLGKAIALAQTIRKGIEGVQSAYTTAQKSPYTVAFPAYPLVQAGLAGAFSALQVKKILSTSDTGGGGGGLASGGGGGTSAPSFNLVQGTPQNQLAQSLSGVSNRPVETFVVASNVTSAQSLNRNKLDEGSI